MAFDRLFDILKKTRTSYPVLTQRIEEAEALSRWPQAVGPAIAKHARAIRVQDSVLWVEVDHPIWKSELHHRKRQILDILNGAIPATKTHSAQPAAKQTLVDLLLLDPRRPAILPKAKT
jgi:predicted nucleic acid-binding Zn ribbon protein